MAIELRCGAATHAGAVRTVNQDAVLAGPVVFAVADGMGGHAAGEVASALTIATMADLPIGAPGAVVLDAVHRANGEVRRQAPAGTEREGMGTTLSGLAIAIEGGADVIVAFNVGDSRLYSFDAGDLVQLSVDHSLVAEMVEEGSISDSEAATHRSRNIITRAIGIQDDVDIDHWQIEPRPGQTFLVCSDGLTNELSDAEVEEVLREGLPPQAAVERLLALAVDRGARDNVSVLVVAIDGVTSEAELDEDTKPRHREVQR